MAGIKNNDLKSTTARNLLISGSLFVGLFVTGTLGFIILEGYSFIDALYMTVNTVATVGFREIAPLDTAGKLFTIVLILSSLGIVGITLTNFSKLLIDGQLQQRIKDYNVKKRIVKLDNHVIVCGYGRNGFQACEELIAHGIDFIIVEKRENVVARIRETPERLFIQGDAASEDVLHEAQISKAKALITALPNDADNIYVVLTARELNPNIKIISRASEFNSDIKLRRAGANNVIMPDRIGGQRMAKLVAQPDVVEFWDYVLLQSVKDVSLEVIRCGNPALASAPKTMKELKLRELSGANIVGLKTEDGSYIFNPSADFELSPTDSLFVFGSPEQIAGLRALLKQS